jgi:DNA-binding MarR family transcriptional regulator
MVKLPEEMTANPDVSAILLDARKIAEDRKNETLTSLHVLLALVQRAPKSILKLIEDAGGTKPTVVAAIERAMQTM